MPAEYFVSDSIVASLIIKAPAPRPPPETGPRPEPWFRGVSQLLGKVCLPKPREVKLFGGRAYLPVYANNLDPKYSCSWTDTGDGGGAGQIVLSWVNQPRLRVRVKVVFFVAKDRSGAWLTVDYNPTTLLVGHNVHPAAFIDPQTGEIVNYPSSSWPAMTRAFSLGFEFLEALTEPSSLFDADTRLIIQRGHFHLVRVQYAATKAVPNVTDFLQVGTVIYGQTKARGQGIVNNAKDLGLTFKAYAHPDSDDDRLSGFMLQKKHGTTLHASVSFYDKLIRLQQMHQEGTLTPAEVQTVDRSVREDITLHSTFIQYVAEAAQKKLRRMIETDRKFFDLISPEEFLQGTPQSTVWWLQRAIYILSHRRVKGHWVSYSFATWLVPFVETELLHFDVVAGITTEGYHALLALHDRVAVAWRSDKTPGTGDWANRLAKVAGCTRATVYNRRDEWWRKYRVDIARPLQMYSDILYYGHNSIAKPENITALMVAVEQEDGDEVVRLHAEAIDDFERKRVEIVNPALVNPPRTMELTLPHIARPELDNFDDLPPDFDVSDLDAVVPTRPTSASPIAKVSSKSVVLRAPRCPLPPLSTKLLAPFDDLPPDFDDVDPDEAVLIRPVSARPMAKETVKKVRLLGMYRPPPPPPQKKIRLRGMYCPPPPPPQKKVVLRGLYRPPPPPPQKKVRLRGFYSPPPPPVAKKLILGGRRSPRPPTKRWSNSDR